jgi:hypothetical protein
MELPVFECLSDSGLARIYLGKIAEKRKGRKYRK